MEDGSLSMSMDPSLMPMELPPVQLIPSGFGNDQMLPKPEDLLMSNGMMSMPMQVPQPLPMVAMGEQGLHEMMMPEDNSLASCESFLAGCQQQSQFLKVGSALLAIHDKQLFKPSCSSFSEYITAHPGFGFGPRQAMRLVAATKLVAKFPPQLARPANERQVRPLVSLDFDQAVEIWTKANLIAEETGEPVTHKLIQELLGKQEPSHHPTTGAAPAYRDWKNVVGAAAAAAAVAAAAAAANSVALSNAANSACESSVWQTPTHILTRVKCLFQGVIDLDPCSDIVAQEVIRAKKFYCMEEDGLLNKNKWGGKVYINAPAGGKGAETLQGLFLQRAVAEYSAETINEAVLLVKAAIGDPWFSTVYEYPHCFLTERLSFLTPTGEHTTHTHGHVVLYLGSNIDGFCDLFSEMGVIPGHNSWSRNSQGAAKRSKQSNVSALAPAGPSASNLVSASSGGLGGASGLVGMGQGQNVMGTTAAAAAAAAAGAAAAAQQLQVQQAQQHQLQAQMALHQQQQLHMMQQQQLAMQQQQQMFQGGV